MRKNLLLIVVLFTCTTGFAQFKLGFQFSPTLSTNRVNSDSNTITFENEGAALRVAMGPVVDYPITETYYISSGIMFVSKRAAFKASQTEPSPQEIVEKFSLQYVKVPLSLKLYTNEVAIDKKLYFQMGGALEFLVNDEQKSLSSDYTEDFRLLDSSLLIGLGMEYKVGLTTIVYGGFSYHRGLINSISEHIEFDGDLSLKNDYIGLDMGVKF